MGRNTTAMKRGWNWNEGSSCLTAMVNGRDIFELYSTSTSQRLKISGDTAGYGRLEVHQGNLKIHNHSIASGYCAEFKTEYTAATGTHYAIQPTTIIEGTVTAGAGGGIYNNYYIGSGHSITAASAGYWHSLVNNFQNQGTINGAGVIAGCQWNLISDDGTYTALNLLTNLWLDTHLAQTISAGTFYMLNMTVNGRLLFH